MKEYYECKECGFRMTPIERNSMIIDAKCRCGKSRASLYRLVKINEPN